MNTSQRKQRKKFMERVITELSELFDEFIIDIEKKSKEEVIKELRDMQKGLHTIK